MALYPFEDNQGNKRLINPDHITYVQTWSNGSAGTTIESADVTFNGGHNVRFDGEEARRLWQLLDKFMTPPPIGKSR